MSNTIWIFAYGSLIWDRPFKTLQEKKVVVKNLSRQFCVYSYVYRGTEEKPGLVLGLDEGGSCEGLIIEISEDDYENVYEREMVTDVYHEAMLHIDGKAVRGFVADCVHPQYAGKLSLEDEIRIIKTASGKGGTNAEYFLKTIEGLKKYDIRDPYMQKLLELYHKS